MSDYGESPRPSELQMQWHNESFRRVGDLYVPYDPINREPILPTEPPRVLRQDRELSVGNQFLREFGNRLNVTVLLGSHSEMTDAGGQEFERDVNNADVYLLEGLGWTRRLQQGLDMLSQQGRTSSNQEVLGWLQKPFHRRIAGAISDSKTAISFADVDAKNDPLRRGMLEQGRFVHSLQGEMVGGEDQHKKEAAILNTFTYESMREWFMVLQVGHEVAYLAQSPEYGADLRYKLGQGNVDVLMTVGGTHRNVSNKLSRFGVRVTPHRVGPSHDNPANTLVADSIDRGTMNVHELQRVAAS